MQTALSSVVTADITNIKRKVMTISTAKDWPMDPTGIVPKKVLGVTSNIRASVPLASMDPSN